MLTSIDGPIHCGGIAACDPFHIKEKQYIQQLHRDYIGSGWNLHKD